MSIFTRLFSIIVSAIITAGCSTTGSIKNTDPRYEKISSCGANVVVFVYADATLQVRTQNHVRLGDLSPQLTSLVEKKVDAHPSAEYLKVIVSDIGTVQLRRSVERARASTADLMANAKLKHKEDRVLVLQEILPRLEEIARSSCREADYKFSALRRNSPLPIDVAPTAQPVVNSAPAVERAANTVIDIPAPIHSQYKKSDVLGSEIDSKEVPSTEVGIKPPEPTIYDNVVSVDSNRNVEVRRARSLIREANSKERSAIIDAVSKTLFDPESARYREVHLIPGSLACVKVNAKNRFGGYTGFQSMVAAFVGERWYSMHSLSDTNISCFDLIADVHAKQSGEMSQK